MGKKPKLIFKPAKTESLMIASTSSLRVYKMKLAKEIRDIDSVLINRTDNFIDSIFEALASGPLTSNEILKRLFKLNKDFEQGYIRAKFYRDSRTLRRDGFILRYKITQGPYFYKIVTETKK